MVQFFVYLWSPAKRRASHSVMGFVRVGKKNKSKSVGVGKCVEMIVIKEHRACERRL